MQADMRRSGIISVWFWRSEKQVHLNVELIKLSSPVHLRPEIWFNMSSFNSNKANGGPRLCNCIKVFWLKSRKAKVRLGCQLDLRVHIFQKKKQIKILVFSRSDVNRRFILHLKIGSERLHYIVQRQISGSEMQADMRGTGIISVSFPRSKNTGTFMYLTKLSSTVYLRPVI